MSGSVRRIAVFGPESTGKTQLAEKLAARFGAPLVREYAREFWDAHGAIALGDIEAIACEQWRREDAAVAALVASPTTPPATGSCNLLGYSLERAADDLQRGNAEKCNLLGYKTGGAGGGQSGGPGGSAVGGGGDGGSGGERDRASGAGAAGVVICDTEALTTVLWSDLLYGSCPEAVRRGAEERCRGYALYLLLDVDVPFAPDPQRCFPAEEDRRRCAKVWQGALERRGLPHVWIRGDWTERERAAVAAVEAVLRG